MRKNTLLFGTLALVAALGLACGDDTNPPTPDTAVPDQTVYQDMGSDGMQPDMRVDAMQSDQAIADMALDTTGADIPTTDTTTTDTTVDSATTGDGSAASNSTCQTAQLVTLSAGKATVNGSKTASDGDNLQTCGTTTLAATDLWYKFKPTVGKIYRITFKPQGSGGRIAAWEDNSFNCSASSITSACDTTYVSGGSTDSLYVTSKTGGDIYFVADGISAGTYDAYTFSFEIDTLTPPANTTCATAQALTLSGTPPSATANGDTTLSSNEFVTSVNCGGSTDYDGPQLYYKVTLVAGKIYNIDLTPTFSSYVYVFQASACSGAAAINTSCGSGTSGVDGYISSSGGTLGFAPAAGGDYIIAVDSSSATTSGSFTLKVEEAAKPANDACAGAKALTFTSGAFSETGDTFGATSTVNYTASGCTGNTTAGPDVFYSVPVQKGYSYSFTLNGSGFDEALYVLTSCGGACAAGMGADSSTSSSETVTYTAAAAGTIYVGVDGRNVGEFGTFTLSGVEKLVSANNTCATAEALTMTAGKATSTGDTAKATNAVTISSSGCTGWTSNGFDLFYRITLTAGTTYTVTLTPDSSFDPMLYVFTDCSKPESTCQTGWGLDTVGSGTAEVVTVTPTTTGTFYIGVDSYSASEYGTFTIEVK